MIKLSNHTAREMIRRNITSAFIEAAVAMPDRVTADPTDPALTRSFKAIVEYGGRTLRVVHRPDGVDTFVVTAHWDREAKI